MRGVRQHAVKLLPPSDPPVTHDITGSVPDDGAVSSASSAPTSSDHESPDEPPPLPDLVRQRVVALAATALPTLSTDAIPGPLRQFVKFTPARRAKLAGPALAAALATDLDFRQRIGEAVVTATGDLGAAIKDGARVETANPVEVAAIAYLAQAPRWEQLALAAAPSTADPAEARLRQLTAQLAKAKAAAKTEIDRARRDAATERLATEQLRSELKRATAAVHKLEQRLAKVTGDLAAGQGRRRADAAEHAAMVRRSRTELATAQHALAAATEAARHDHNAERARQAALLTTLEKVAAGLRTELSLTDLHQSPADTVAAGLRHAAPDPGRVGGRDDVARLDVLLVLPHVHVIVDGYNVTKTGFGELTLERQRGRLVRGLAALAAQTNAEITVVFDGTHRMVGLAQLARGVRVLFSEGGQIADELIGELVRAEPAGRNLVVVSSDGEVATAAQRAGGHAVPAQALVDRLARA